VYPNHSQLEPLEKIFIFGKDETFPSKGSAMNVRKQLRSSLAYNYLTNYAECDDATVTVKKNNSPCRRSSYFTENEKK
jgi:hypothetical protein